MLESTCRELAIQIAEQFRALGAGMSLRDCVIIGGVDMQAQGRELARRPHVVIATPGRLKVCSCSHALPQRCMHVHFQHFRCAHACVGEFWELVLLMLS